MTDTVAAASPQAPSTQAASKTAAPSAQDLLKQAVTGVVRKTSDGRIPSETTASKGARSMNSRLPRLALPRVGSAWAPGIAAAAFGVVVGAASMAVLLPRGDSAGPALARIEAEIDAGRSETARINAEIGRIAATIAKSGERAAEDAKTARTELAQRLARTEQTIAGKIAALTERHDGSEREQAARIASLASLVEKRTAPAPAAVPQNARSAEPVQTGSLSDPKAASDARAATEARAAADSKAAADAKVKAAISNWAVRDVYDGIAVLEDRKQRLVEVARGDVIPGLGRAESIERRGRSWVVVTKDGVITSQDW